MDNLILKILKKSKYPLHVKEISSILMSEFNTFGNKKSVLFTLKTSLKHEVIRSKNKWEYLPKKVDPSIQKVSFNKHYQAQVEQLKPTVKEIKQKPTFRKVTAVKKKNKQSEISENLKKLLNKYNLYIKNWQDCERSHIKRSTINKLESKIELNNYKKKVNDIHDKIIRYLINKELELVEIEKHVTHEIYELIISDRIVIDLINKNLLVNKKKLSYEEKLLEFKLLCKDVWEDGVVDQNEEKELDLKIKKLGISLIDADRIFNQIKGEFEEQKIDDNRSPSEDIFDEVIKIDDFKFHFKIIDQPMSPLFWHKFENNIDIIFINNNHDHFDEFNQKQLFNITASLYATKMMFSDNSGEIFLNRFQNNLNLLRF